MTEFLQQAINGLALGAIYALIALGYTMVYGVLRFINFAHSDIFMIGAFSGYYLSRYVPGASLATGVVVLLGAMAICAMLGMIIEKLAYRPLRGAPRLIPLISAIGMSFFLQDVIRLFESLWRNAFNLVYPSMDALNRRFEITETIDISMKSLVVIVAALAMLWGLHTIVNRTKIGTAIRAVAEDQAAASLMGINVNRMISLTFLIGGALAGTAGFISGLYNNSAWFQQGFRGGLMAFTAAVLGGIGNLTGAVLGGLIIGIVSALSDFYLDPRWTQPVVFGILVVIMVFRPSGLLGEQVPEKV